MQVNKAGGRAGHRLELGVAEGRRCLKLEGKV